MTDNMWSHVNDVAKNLEAQLRPVRRLARENRDCIDAASELLDLTRADLDAARRALDRLAERVEALEAELADRGILPPLWRLVRRVVGR